MRPPLCPHAVAEGYARVPLQREPGAHGAGHYGDGRHTLVDVPLIRRSITVVRPPPTKTASYFGITIVLRVTYYETCRKLGDIVLFHNYSYDAGHPSVDDPTTNHYDCKGRDTDQHLHHPRRN